MVPRTSVIFLLAILLIGCRPASPTPTAASVTDATTLPDAGVATVTPTAPVPGVNAEQVRNASYVLGATDTLQTVQLVNGIYQQGKPGDTDFLLVRVTDFIALGDVDGQMGNEAAALISENYGGTGVFVFLVLFAEQNNEAFFQTSVFVDDRPQINALAIEEQEIFLDVTVHGLDEQGNPEPMCCPKWRTIRHYRLVYNQLDMTDYSTFTLDGKQRSIQIESPANGEQTSGSVQVKGTVTVAPFENNLTYSIKDAGAVELSRGAVTVTAENLGGPGTFDAVIPLDNISSSALIFIEIQENSVANGILLAMDSVQLVVK